jgi:hypothetical protein
MIRSILSSFFTSKNEIAQRDRIHGELSALKLKSDLIERYCRKTDNESFSAWGRERELKLWLSLPGSECISPRDGSPLLKSEDGMFLAMLLHRSKGARQFIEMMEEEGVRTYFPETKGCVESVAKLGKTFKARFNSSTVRGYFKETFLHFRSRLSSRETAHHDFFIGGKLVRASDSAGDKALWKLGANLERPFTAQGDSLLEQLHDVSFFDWIPGGFLNAPTLKHGEVYCPMDGPVTPIKAAEKTPAFSWEMMCGREWALYLCPKCLGTFDRWMWKMN